MEIPNVDGWLERPYRDLDVQPAPSFSFGARVDIWAPIEAEEGEATQAVDVTVHVGEAGYALTWRNPFATREEPLPESWVPPAEMVRVEALVAEEIFNAAQGES